MVLGIVGQFFFFIHNVGDPPIHTTGALYKIPNTLWYSFIEEFNAKAAPQPNMM